MDPTRSARCRAVRESTRQRHGARRKITVWQGDLAPSRHPDVSKARALVLGRVGCMITQFADTPTHDGVVKGAFHAAGATDLAVLCHRGAHEVVYGSGAEAPRSVIQSSVGGMTQGVSCIGRLPVTSLSIL